MGTTSCYLSESYLVLELAASAGLRLPSRPITGRLHKPGCDAPPATPLNPASDALTFYMFGVKM
jgi:hypothetical protein